ncbi:zinc finger MYM-type protein 1-like protein [Tanacetum coccineum]
MERYFKRNFPSINGDGEESIPKRIPETIPDPIPKPGPIPSSSDGIDLGTLPWDPSERPSIFNYDPNIRDEIWRKYLSNGACQSRGHKDSIGKQGGNDAFATDGFNSWSKKYGLNNHVGEVNSYHNKSLQKCELLLKQKQSIHVAFKKQIEGEAKDYGIRLNLSVETCRFLLKASLPFRGHDEKKHSMNRGLFLELYELLANQNEEIRKVVARTPLNCTLKSPRIQKQICECFSEEVLDSIIKEIGDDVFSLLVDESSDVSKKEQMALVLRYVDKLGIVKERFAGVVHVEDTSSATLKASIDTLFAQHKLSLKQVRGAFMGKLITIDSYFKSKSSDSTENATRLCPPNKTPQVPSPDHG